MGVMVKSRFQLLDVAKIWVSQWPTHQCESWYLTWKPSLPLLGTNSHLQARELSTSIVFVRVGTLGGLFVEQSTNPEDQNWLWQRWLEWFYCVAPPFGSTQSFTGAQRELTVWVRKEWFPLQNQLWLHWPLLACHWHHETRFPCESIHISSSSNKGHWLEIQYAYVACIQPASQRFIYTHGWSENVRTTK